MKLQVEDNNSLFRDTNSGAIINMNKSGAQISREARHRVQHDKDRLTNLESDMSDIKSLLKQLLEK
jgi:hypothetical protein